MPSFIGEAIEPVFAAPPTLSKKAGPPVAFIWRAERHEVVRVVAEWHDYRGLDRDAPEGRPPYAARGKRLGSWGIGRDFYRVVTTGDRVFDIYYDRRPLSCTRTGSWRLYQEWLPGEQAD